MLSLLLQRPDADVHVLDLLSAVDGAPAPEAAQGHQQRGRRPQNLAVAVEGHAGPQLDAQARGEYRRRVQELRTELAEAERFNDVGRAERLRVEIEHLVRELKRAYGHDGRPRLALATSERARINVRNNLSTTFGILERSHPALYRHLRGALRTGTFCSYQPERQIPWKF
jgi:hypothetical protein